MLTIGIVAYVYFVLEFDPFLPARRVRTISKRLTPREATLRQRRSPPPHSDPARTGIDDNNDDWFQRLQEKWGAYARDQDAHRKDAGAGNMASGLYDHARRRRKDVSAVDGDVDDELSKAAARAADKQIARANKAAKGKRPKPQRQKDDKAASTRPKPKRRTDDKAASTLPRPPECSRWLREDPPRRTISKLWGSASKPGQSKLVYSKMGYASQTGQDRWLYANLFHHWRKAGKVAACCTSWTSRAAAA